MLTGLPLRLQSDPPPNNCCQKVNPFTGMSVMLSPSKTMLLAGRMVRRAMASTATNSFEVSARFQTVCSARFLSDLSPPWWCGAEINGRHRPGIAVGVGGDQATTPSTDNWTEFDSTLSARAYVCGVMVYGSTLMTGT